MSFRHSQRVFQYCKAYLAPGRRAAALPTPKQSRQIPCDRLCNGEGFIYPGPQSMEWARGKGASGEQEMFACSLSWGAFGTVANCIRLNLMFHEEANL